MILRQPIIQIKEISCGFIACEIGTTTCGSHVELSHVKSEEPHVVISDVTTKQVNFKKFTVTQ